MKKTLFAFLALATAFGATSCQSDEELTQPTGKPMVINAVAEGIGTKTRAEMAYKYDILWSEGDQIYVAGNSKNATFTLTDGKGTTEGTFACTESLFTSGDAVEAYYPASLVDDGSLVWPAEQTSSTVIPMYSKQTLGNAEEENFSFASLGAMLQIVFNTEQAGVTLKSITLKDGTNPLSGAFTVNKDGKAEMEANTDAPGITLDLGTGSVLGKGANFFHIAVPAGTYSNLTITFTATDNSTCTFVNGSATLTHNTVGRLVLTGTEFKKFGQGKAEVNASAGITGNKVKWVQLWENGPKFAEYNVGVTDGKAESFGGYYAWGGNQDKVDDHNMGTDALSGTDDTATNLWGSNWRMPTKAELQALLDNCDVEWTTVNGVNGRKFTGKAEPYSSNSVFLPAGSNCYDGTVNSPGKYGYYRSSSPNGPSNAYYLYFESGKQYVNDGFRYFGYSVRAVLKEAPATKGTAKATIGEESVDVNWVQLWADGPKFAEYNVADKMSFEDAAETGADYVWGANWRTPSKDELNELVKAASSAGSEKVTCVYGQVSGNWGFTFTSKEEGYTDNSVFFPAQIGNSSLGSASYWSGTADGSLAWDMYLDYSDGDWYGSWYSDAQDDYYLVRPVLAK